MFGKNQLMGRDSPQTPENTSNCRMILLHVGISVTIQNLVGALEHALFVPFSWEFHNPN
jgi:hypothetical protein